MPARKIYEYTIKLHRWQQLSSHDLFAFLVWCRGVFRRASGGNLLCPHGADDDSRLAVYSVPVLQAEERGD
jgi:hypothetical protein